MEEETTTSGFSMESHKTRLDEMMESVMPDTWVGHARIAIAGKDLSEKQTEKVLKHTKNIVEKKGHPADKTAEAIIEKLGY